MVVCVLCAVAVCVGIIVYAHVRAFIYTCKLFYGKLCIVVMHPFKVIQSSQLFGFVLFGCSKVWVAFVVWTANILGDVE